MLIKTDKTTMLLRRAKDNTQYITDNCGRYGWGNREHAAHFSKAKATTMARVYSTMVVMEVL